MKIEIDGSKIRTEADFHAALASALRLPAHYGANLDALWDVLTTDVERPVMLVWNNSTESKRALGERFDLIVDLLKRIEAQDVEWGLSERLELKLA